MTEQLTMMILGMLEQLPYITLLAAAWFAIFKPMMEAQERRLDKLTEVLQELRDSVRLLLESQIAKGEK